MVSGPIRRASIARFITGACRGIKVGTFPGGWTIAGHTGATQTATTFDGLLDLVAPRCAATSWDDLDSALNAYAGPTRPEDFGDYLPRTAEPHHDPQPVLTDSVSAPTHLRLTAFALGVRVLDPGTVAVDFPHRPAAFRLVAENGNVLGAAALPHGT